MSRMSHEAPARKLWVERPNIEEKRLPSDWSAMAALYEIPLVPGINTSLREIANQKLGELQALGFDSVYVMGAFEAEKDPAAGIKGSGVPFCLRDHRKVDKRWGTNEDLKYLFHEAHRRGMGIGVDLVLNHVSRRNALARRPGFCLRDARGELQTAACTAMIDGRPEELFFSDVVQLDLSNPAVREELKQIVLSIVHLAPTDCKLFFRVDMAAQMMNRELERRWGMRMPEREWMAEIIEAARAINPNVAFIAEVHGEATAEELRAIGYNVFPSKSNEQQGIAKGWHDAHTSRSPRQINFAIASLVYAQDNPRASAMATVGGHDEALFMRTMGDWGPGAMAMTLMMRPFLWYGSTEWGQDYNGDRSSLPELENEKAVPFGVENNFSIKDPHLLATWKRICLISKRVMSEMHNEASYHELKGSQESSWVGYAIKPKSANGPVYYVVGNPTNQSVTFYEFGQIDPKTVWLINAYNGQRERLV